MLMLKQSLVCCHWFCYFINFSFDKMFFSIFKVSRDRERWLTASLRHFPLCGVLLERSLFWNNESFTAAHVRDYSTAIICFVQKSHWHCCNIGCPNSGQISQKFAARLKFVYCLRTVERIPATIVFHKCWHLLKELWNRKRENWRTVKPSKQLCLEQGITKN